MCVCNRLMLIVYIYIEKAANQYINSLEKCTNVHIYLYEKCECVNKCTDGYIDILTLMLMWYVILAYMYL